MEPLVYIMAILGCGEGEQPCAELGLAQVRYESRADCVAATAAELGRRLDLPYPVVVAQCRRSDEAAETLSASEVDLPVPEENRVFPPGEARETDQLQQLFYMY